MAEPPIVDTVQQYLARAVLLAEQLGTVLHGRGLRVTTAESCTGGLVASAITAVPGSSGWFDEAFISYANRAKHQRLGVPLPLLEEQGAVSEAVVQAMARGAAERAQAQVAIAISGVAGPDGGTDSSPVGTVWMAWSLPDGTVDAKRHYCPGDRGTVRALATCLSLEGALQRLIRPG